MNIYDCIYRRFLLAIVVVVTCCYASLANAETEVKALEVQEVAVGVFVAAGPVEDVNAHNIGYIANLSFIVGDESVAVVDTGGSKRVGEQLLAAIKGVTDLPIAYVINTHAHPDHIFGNAAFVDTGAKFVAHSNFNTALSTRGPHYQTGLKNLMGEENFKGSELISADISVEESKELTLELGNRNLTLTAYRTAHTDNDLSVWDEKTNTIFLGDLLFEEHIPALDGSILGWLSVMEELTTKSFDHVVPGHGNVNGVWPQIMEPQKRYFEVLAKELRAHIAKGTPIGDASKNTGLSEKGKWKLFGLFNTRNVTAGFAELEWE